MIAKFNYPIIQIGVLVITSSGGLRWWRRET